MFYLMRKGAWNWTNKHGYVLNYIYQELNDEFQVNEPIDGDRS